MRYFLLLNINKMLGEKTLKRIILVLWMALGIMAVSNCVAEAFIPAWQKLANLETRWQNRADRLMIEKRVAHLKPVIDEICKKQKVNPEVFYGLIMTESCANQYAIDYMFFGGITHSACVGLGQLNEAKLPKNEQQVCHRVGLRWQAAHLQRRKQQRLWKKYKSEACRAAYLKSLSVENDRLADWIAVDRRFDARWNLEQTILYFKSNLGKTWKESLAIMAHHGGGNDPVRRVIKYAWDHERIRLQACQVPKYVESRKLDYFKLYNDHCSPGHGYWANKGDGHLTYAFSPMAATKVFKNYWQGLGHNVRLKIMGCSKPELKVAHGKNATVAMQPNEMNENQKNNSENGGNDMLLIGLNNIIGWFTSKCHLFTDGAATLWDGLKAMVVNGGQVLLALAFVLLVVVSIFSYIWSKAVRRWPVLARIRIRLGRTTRVRRTNSRLTRTQIS